MQLNYSFFSILTIRFFYFLTIVFFYIVISIACDYPSLADDLADVNITRNLQLLLRLLSNILSIFYVII